ncbi:hypothetical protein [Falsiroseomonas sp.]|uniref:hypothetical protein n=1 Tax=Falsiroseomonas sp. TaxID=2870721 RepID=UPI003F6EB844
MTRLILAALLALSAAPALAQQAGTYLLEGRGRDGAAYQGEVQFKPVGPEVWQVTWRTGSGVTQGLALRQGTRLAVGYVSRQGETGVALYEVQRDGTLTGSWTQGASGARGQERLYPR